MQQQQAQAGFRGSQDGQQQQMQAQCQPDTPLFAAGAGSSSYTRTPFEAFAVDASQPIGSTVCPNVALNQVQIGFGGMRVSATSAAVYDAPASVTGSVVGVPGSQPGTATAAAGQGGFDMQVPSAYTQQQQQQLMQQPAGQFSGVSAATAALYATPTGAGTPGVEPLSGTAGAAAAAAQQRLGVQAMLGVQQQMIQQPQQQGYSAVMAACSQGGAGAPAMLMQQQPGQVVGIQQAPLQQQQHMAHLGLNAQAQQRLHHLRQQLQQLRLQQQEQQQQQGVGGSCAYGSMGMVLDPSSVQAAAAVQLSAGPMYQQVAAAGTTGTVNAFAAAGGGSSYQPVLIQQPAFLQQQQQQVLLVPAQNMGMAGAGVMMAGPCAYQVGQSAGVGVQAMPAGSMALTFNGAAVAQQNGMGGGVFGYH
jgi:hypothetical protein